IACCPALSVSRCRSLFWQPLGCLLRHTSSNPLVEIHAAMALFRHSRRKALRPKWLLHVATAIGLGCQPAEEITSYTVAKPPPPVRPKALPQRPAGDRQGAAGNEAGSAAPARILGAVVPRARQAWFFKLTGPPEAVAAKAEAFVRFVKSLDFSGGAPRWTLPE